MKKTLILFGILLIPSAVIVHAQTSSNGCYNVQNQGSTSWTQVCPLATPAPTIDPASLITPVQISNITAGASSVSVYRIVDAANHSACYIVANSATVMVNTKVSVPMTMPAISCVPLK